MFVNQIKICPDLHKLQLWFSRLWQYLFLKLLRQWTHKMGRFLSTLIRLEFIYQIKIGSSCFNYYISFYTTVRSNFVLRGGGRRLISQGRLLGHYFPLKLYRLSPVDKLLKGTVAPPRCLRPCFINYIIVYFTYEYNLGLHLLSRLALHHFHGSARKRL
jgi:hypothetical protein